MANVVRNIVIGGVVIAGGIYLRKLFVLKTASDNITYKLVGVGQPSISGGELKCDINLQFTNPTNKTVNLDTIFLDVNFDNGAPFGSVTKTSFGTIEANNRTTIAIPVSTGNLTLLGVLNLLKLITNGTEGYKNLTIKGNYKAEGFLKSINETVNIF